jgi:hypothetical protein
MDVFSAADRLLPSTDLPKDGQHDVALKTFFENGGLSGADGEVHPGDRGRRCRLGLAGRDRNGHGTTLRASVDADRSRLRLRPALCAVMARSAAVAWRERVAIDHRILATALIGLAAGCTVGAIGLALLPGVTVGLAIAPALARRIDRRRARICVLVISALSAIALLR